MKKALAGLALLLGSSTFGLLKAAGSAHVQADLVSELSTISSEPFWVAVQLKHDPHWHTYGKDPGDSGLPTSMKWSLPEGYLADPFLWPPPETILTPPLTSYGYTGEVLFLTRITPSSTGPHGSVPLTVEVKWLECKEECLPGKARLSLVVQRSDQSVVDETQKELFARAQAQFKEEPDAANDRSVSFLSILGLAFLGGLILNIMPCVLPVLAIKVLGFTRQSKSGGPNRFVQGGLYTLGVLVSFWALAGLLLALKAGGQQLGWGFQLQSPVFVSFLILLFFILTLNLFGVFEIGLSFTRAQSKITGTFEPFFGGVLASIVATPCTAPFMGVALGAALALPAWQGLMVFTALGLGMALPFAALLSHPRWLSLLPKPGPWMDWLKRALGLVLLVTVAWLMWVLKSQISSWLPYMGLLMTISTAAGVVFGRRMGTKPPLGWLIPVAILILGGFFWPQTAPKSSAVLWDGYTEQKVDDFRSTGRPVFVDFTASWCLTCQVNERVVLNKESVQNEFKSRNVALLKADYTNQDSTVTRALQKLKRSGVPTYVLYPADPGKEPVLLPEVLTPSLVIEALRENLN